MSYVVAIVGSYRRDGTIEIATDALLASAEAGGAHICKINLLDKRMEFCTNCRSCTQERGPFRGRCVQRDDLASILCEIDAADVLVLAAPVNFFNVTAIFRRFMERLVGYAYWPWGQRSPSYRAKLTDKRAVLITSAAMPGLFIPIATGAPRALRVTARALGAKPIANLWIGLAAGQQQSSVSEKVLAKARRIGMQIA